MMYDLHMAINKGKVCIMYYIFFVEFLGHNFVSGLRTLISKNLKKLVFFQLCGDGNRPTNNTCY